jgi:hypothetical protein
LPLFLHLDEERVRAVTDVPLIKARPPFHYRLPDCEIHLPGWGLHVAWNDWLEVEALAADRERLGHAVRLPGLPRPAAEALARRLGQGSPGQVARPLIASPDPSGGAFGPRLLVSLAVRRYGGTPLQLRPSDQGRGFDYDGVVITGGHDVDPVLYAAEPEVEPNHDPARDAFESAVIDEACGASAAARHLPRRAAAERAARRHAVPGARLAAQQDLQPLDRAAAEDAAHRSPARGSRN